MKIKFEYKEDCCSFCDPKNTVRRSLYDPKYVYWQNMRNDNR